MTPATIDERRSEFIGSSVEQLDTPALLLDVKACDRNLRKMAEYFQDRDALLRPHFKNHKCASLARRQLQAGSAVGMTCAKLGEAEVLAANGFKNILIANQVVGPHKMKRLVEVAKQAQITVAVDELSQASAISTTAEAAGVTVGVLVEVDCDMGRCGVAPGEPTVELVQRLVDLRGIRFEGIQAFEGHLVYVSDRKERSQKTRAALALAVATRRLLEQQGIAVQVISGGSTATYDVGGNMAGFDEIQAGTYPTMDWRYHQLVPEFEIALSLIATVISRPRPGTAVLDMGAKAAGCEFGIPKIKDHPEIELPPGLSEEHMTIRNTPPWVVGEMVQVLPSHACTTCNLYREMYVHEDGRVVDVWPIEASGSLT